MNVETLLRTGLAGADGGSPRRWTGVPDSSTAPPEKQLCPAPRRQESWLEKRTGAAACWPRKCCGPITPERPGAVVEGELAQTQPLAGGG